MDGEEGVKKNMGIHLPPFGLFGNFTHVALASARPRPVSNAINSELANDDDRDFSTGESVSQSVSHGEI